MVPSSSYAPSPKLSDFTVLTQPPSEQLSGCRNGGYVNDPTQSNPTYEFFPPTGSPITSPFLASTLPANLYPLTWLLPSGNLLVQSTWSTALLNWRTRQETLLDDMPDAVRTYPASAGSAMLALTPQNNWTATIMFCGGSNIEAVELVMLLGGVSSR